MSGSFGLASSTVALFVVVLGTGCVIPKSVGLADDGAEDGSMASDSSGMPPGATSVVGDTGVTTGGEPDPSSSGTTVVGGSEETAGDFIVPSDGGIFDPCDPWTQDCPPGERCVPWANDGGNAWNSARCSPIVEDPDELGEPCTVELSGTSGLDSCELGTMCWDVDPETNEGTCAGFCTGSEADPKCEQEGTVCVIANDGFLPLCLPTCDPVLPECEPGQACYPFDDVFVCAPEGENPGGVGESCEDIAVCQPGLVCVSSERVPDCPSAVACCTPWCDVTDPMPPCLPEQVCTPWYEPGMAPEGYENLGACMLPA